MSAIERLPRYRDVCPGGVGWRVDYENIGISRGATVADIIKFEEEELGNDYGLGNQLMKELGNWPYWMATWVCCKRSDALVYRTEGDRSAPAKILFGNDARVVVSDDAGGYLVLDRTAKDSSGNSIEGLDGTPVLMNPDGTITLYHRTTPEAAAKIRASGKFIPAPGEREVFFSTSPSGQATGYGSAIVKMYILPWRVRVDDAFPGGEVHVAIRGGI